MSLGKVFLRYIRQRLLTDIYLYVVGGQRRYLRGIPGHQQKSRLRLQEISESFEMSISKTHFYFMIFVTTLQYLVLLYGIWCYLDSAVQ